MSFSFASVTILEKMQRRAERESIEDGPVMKFDFITIVTAIASLIPTLKTLFAMCKKDPPPPAPMPAELSGIGVTPETWADASNAKWIAEESWNGTRFKAAVINEAAKKLMKAQGITKRQAKPLAVASLEASRTETVSALATTIHGVKIAKSTVV